MPDVPKLNFPILKQPKSTVIICARGKLTEEDKQELEKYMEFRRKRFEQKKRKSNTADMGGKE